jgi:hypothetical protein
VKTLPKRHETNRKEVKKMPEERTERHRQIRAIKKEVRSLNGGFMGLSTGSRTNPAAVSSVDGR